MLGLAKYRHSCRRIMIIWLLKRIMMEKGRNENGLKSL